MASDAVSFTSFLNTSSIDTHCAMINSSRCTNFFAVEDVNKYFNPSQPFTDSCFRFENVTVECTNVVK